jgi:hypothetical protein
MHGDVLLEAVLFLGPAIAVALAGATLAYREARRRRARSRGLIVGALGAVLRWGLVGCGALAAAVIALKIAAANDQAPLALVAAPWTFAACGLLGLWRWRALAARVGSALEPGGGE